MQRPQQYNVSIRPFNRINMLQFYYFIGVVYVAWGCRLREPCTVRSASSSRVASLYGFLAEWEILYETFAYTTIGLNFNWKSKPPSFVVLSTKRPYKL